NFKEVALYYTPDIVADSFGKSTMPFLQTLHLCDVLGKQLESFSDSPATDSHPFRDFLLRHPHIKGFKMGYSAIDTKSPNINPENLASVFSSLKYFSAPISLCAHLWRSTLASRIEYLNIRAGVWDFETGFEPLPMPMLRQLRIEHHDHVETLKLMQMVMPVASELEHLRTEASEFPHAFHTQFLELLTHAPKLQTIGIYDFSWYPDSVALVEMIQDEYPEVDVREELVWDNWYNDQI
ncbi:unnamed protein product, partial [Rhizoctonia solani]